LLRGGLVAEADRPRLSFFFFAKKFFRTATQKAGKSEIAAAERSTNEVERANILAPGLRRWPNGSRTPYSRLHRRRLPAIGLWEVVSSYSSATAPVSHRISRADPRIKLTKNYARNRGCRIDKQELFRFRSRFV
jgi:hypothetical protein